MCRRRFRSANSAHLETTFLRRCSAKGLSTQERSTFVKVCNGGSSSRCRTRLDGRFPGRGSNESPSVRFAFSERMGKFSNRNPRRTSSSSFRRRETLLSSIPTVRARSLPVSTNPTRLRLDSIRELTLPFLSCSFRRLLGLLRSRLLLPQPTHRLESTRPRSSQLLRRHQHLRGARQLLSRRSTSDPTSRRGWTRSSLRRILWISSTPEPLERHLLPSTRSSAHQINSRPLET